MEALLLQPFLATYCRLLLAETLRIFTVDSDSCYWIAIILFSAFVLRNLLLFCTARTYVRPKLPRIRNYNLMRRVRRAKPLKWKRRERFIDELEEREGLHHNLHPWNRSQLYSFAQHPLFDSVDVLPHFYSIRHWTTMCEAGQLSFCPERRRVLVASRPYCTSAQVKPSTGGALSARSRRRLKQPEYPIVIDTGSSYSLTPSLSDFESALDPAETDTIGGVDSEIQVHGMGTVRWEIEDAVGRVVEIRTKALYVPTARIRLFMQLNGLFRPFSMRPE